MFEKGDLIFFNEEGKELFSYIKGTAGIIVSDRFLLFSYDLHSTPEKIEYYGYDIIVEGRLFKEIPEKFLSRVTDNEENPK